jgi:hypothetical protein
MSALAIVAAGSPPRQPSAARAELADVIERLAELLRERETAAEPVNRLGAIESAFNRANAELEQLRVADGERLAAWILDGARGQRPEPNGATLTAERRLAELAADATAVKMVLPPKAAALEALNVQVRAAQRRRDELRWQVALDAAREYAATDFRDAILAALRAEAVLRGLYGELIAGGNAGSGDIGGLQAAEGLAQIIQATKRVEMPAAQGRGRKLLTALLADPHAEL